MNAGEPVVIRGEQVRLVPPPGIEFAKVTGTWVNDPLTRHLIVGPAYQMSLAAREDFLRERLEPSFKGVYLVIETLDTPEPVAIGAIELRQVSPEHRTAASVGQREEAAFARDDE